MQPSKTKFRTLLLAANPIDTDPLRLDQEARDIKDLLERSGIQHKVSYQTAVRPRDIPHRLRKFRPNIVHFLGHGGPDGGLILEDNEGTASPVPKEALAALFRLFDGVECVILNCCHSAAQAELLAKSVPFVIGMNATIADRAALEFSAGFYQALVDGEDIESAFMQAKLVVQLSNMSRDAMVPELYCGLKRKQERRAGQLEAGRRSMREESIETRADTAAPAKMTAIPSLQDLAEIPWADFEAFALQVIEAKYKGTNINISRSRHAREEGKESEAHYLLGISIESDSQVSYKIWIELALKRLKNVSKSDVSPHLVTALTEKIGKIIIVTNKTFSPSIHSWLQSFSSRTGVQYQLVDGPALINFAHAFLSPARSAGVATGSREESSHDRDVVQVSWWYTLSALDKRPQSLHRAPVTLRSDRPFFVIVEARCFGNTGVYPIKLRLEVPSQEIAIYPYPPSERSTAWGGASEHIQQTFVVWPNSCPESLLSQISIEIESSQPLVVEKTSLNSVRNPLGLLARSDLRSQRAVVASINENIDNWRRRSSFFSGLLIAPPGLGKSFVVAKLRQRCHAEGVLELFFDCESTRTDVDLLLDLFRGLLPFPSSLLDEELIEPISEWCARIGLAKELARQTAEDLCCGPSQGLRIGTRHRVDVACAILSYASADRPILMILEDLHKASPSLLSFLSAIISRRAVAGESSVLFFASTRPFYVGAPNLRSDWLEALGGICSADLNSIYELEAPAHDEARRMLCSSIAGLEDYQADAILQAAGRSPYSIREAVLFLLARRVLAVSDGRAQSTLMIIDPLGVQLTASSRELSRATENRLQLLLANEPDWLRLFLLGGAAYGRRFPVPLILEALHLQEDLALATAVETCARWSIISRSTAGLESLEFDHDLVRESILVFGPSRSRRVVSGTMLKVLGSGGDPVVQGRLAYQAGLAEPCLHAAQVARERARAEGRIADVVELNQLTMHVLDPGIAENVLSELLKTGDQHLIDPALRNIEPPELAAPLEARLERVLEVLLDSVDCLSTIGSGSSGATEATITDARLIAEKLGREDATANLLYLEGRMWFERNIVPKALELHQKADELFSQLGFHKSSARTENLIRQAICLRTIGNSEESIAILRKAARLCPSGDWTTLNKVRSNLGAAFLYTDWTKVRYHWEKQIKQASRRKLRSRLVHAMASLSFIDLFDGNLPKGLEMSKEALELAEKLRLDNQVLRLCLNLSIHSALVGRLKESQSYLLKAEELALRHNVGRRLWRVTGNLATVNELLGDQERARIRDLQTLEQMKDILPAMRLDGREILPFVNIALRAEKNGELQFLLSELPPRVATTAKGYACLLLSGQEHELPGLLGKYSARFQPGPRLLISE